MESPACAALGSSWQVVSCRSSTSSVKDVKIQARRAGKLWFGGVWLESATLAVSATLESATLAELREVPKSELNNDHIVSVLYAPNGEHIQMPFVLAWLEQLAPPRGVQRVCGRS